MKTFEANDEELCGFIRTRPRILCTGGLGYIGSHTVLPLINAGFSVCVLDNLLNSRIDVFHRLKQLLKLQLLQQQHSLQQQQVESKEKQPQLLQPKQQHSVQQQQQSKNTPAIAPVVLENGHAQRQSPNAAAAAVCATAAANCSSRDEWKGDMACQVEDGEEEYAKAQTKVKETDEADEMLQFVQIDILDAAAVRRLFLENSFHAVVHYAGRKSTVESLEQPLKYYATNVGGTINVLQGMRAAGCRVFVFSSSATVYLPNPERNLREDDPLGAINPYGHSKVMVEQILQDTAASEPDYWRIAILRYFNPVGAHSSGLLGEAPVGIPRNLFPVLQNVALGRDRCLTVFGNDYDTPDGTGVRDYVHVEDLAEGHVAALRRLQDSKGGLLEIYNLGTGKGCSTLEVVKVFERICGRQLPYKFGARRQGDQAVVVADPTKAQKILGWRATRTLEEAARSAWIWISRNP